MLRGFVLSVELQLEVRVTASHIYVAICFCVLAFEERHIHLTKAVVEVQAEHLWVSSALRILNRKLRFRVLVKQTGTENVVHVQGK